MNGKQLAQRARAIRLETKRLAQLAGVDEMTAWRTLKGRSVPYPQTQTALTTALIAEERRMLAHLVALHGMRRRKPRTVAA